MLSGCESTLHQALSKQYLIGPSNSPMRLPRFLKAAVKAHELRGVSSVSSNHPATCSATGGAGRGPPGAQCRQVEMAWPESDTWRALPSA